MPEQRLLDLLRRSGGMAAIAGQLEIPPATALAAAEALLPSLQAALRHRIEQAGSPGAGLEGLLALFEQFGGGALAGAVLQQDGPALVAGQDLLGAMFDRAMQDAVIAETARRSAIAPVVIGQVLPLLAMLTGGYLAARAAQLAPADRLAELGPLLDLDERNRLDAMPGITDQSEP